MFFTMSHPPTGQQGWGGMCVLEKVQKHLLLLLEAHKLGRLQKTSALEGSTVSTLSGGIATTVRKT